MCATHTHRREHYLSKDKDCSQLASTSGIPFIYWTATVDVLLSEDQGSQWSLLRYVQ